MQSLNFEKIFKSIKIKQYKIIKKELKGFILSSKMERFIEKVQYFLFAVFCIGVYILVIKALWIAILNLKK
jgi:hypothetical protein